MSSLQFSWTILCRTRAVLRQRCPWRGTGRFRPATWGSPSIPRCAPPTHGNDKRSARVKESRFNLQSPFARQRRKCAHVSSRPQAPPLDRGSSSQWAGNDGQKSTGRPARRSSAPAVPLPAVGSRKSRRGNYHQRGWNEGWMRGHVVKRHENSCQSGVRAGLFIIGN
jgi:hypothetical protein